MIRRNSEAVVLFQCKPIDTGGKEVRVGVVKYFLCNQAKAERCW